MQPTSCMLKGYLTTVQVSLSPCVSLPPGSSIWWIKSDLSSTFKQAGDERMLLIINITTKRITQVLLVGVLPQWSMRWRRDNITPKIKTLSLVAATA